MISKAKVKYIKSLQLKKYRIQEQCFVVEGAKSVKELLQSDFQVLWLAASNAFISANEKLIVASKAEYVESTEAEMSVLGQFQTNDSALALVTMKPNLPPVLSEEELMVVLDDIRDPGNLGTIVRTADWYGVRNIIASEETTDFYNPKVLNASMGSFCRVNVFYTSLTDYLTSVRKPIYGAFMDGMDVHTLNYSGGGLLVIGNESNGISKSVEKLVTQKITIPRYGKAESLNAAIAAGIILDSVRQSKK
ncbi:MAG: RNA methyltransferase [Cyclobacteriaceae bacterium]|jgi:TrmH family RNA methyltransferase|nr:RNA methyltransferase [Cyclobacteriaceae bacterium]